MIRATVDSSGRALTAVRDGSGDLKVITWGISANGATVRRLGDSGSAASGIGDNGLATLSDGVVSALRDDSGSLKLIAWSITAGGSLTRVSDSGTQAGTSSLINLLPVTGVSGVTMVTPVRTVSGTLKVIGWGPACLRLRSEDRAATQELYRHADG